MARQWLTGWWNHSSAGENSREWQQQRQRIERYFDCYWVSVWGDQKARVSSISPTGCYIDSRFTVPPEGTHVREICMSIPGGELSVHGTVLCPTPGVGFAVRFADMDDDTQATLNSLVHTQA